MDGRVRREGRAGDFIAVQGLHFEPCCKPGAFHDAVEAQIRLLSDLFSLIAVAS